MKRRSQGRTSVVTESSLPSSPTTLKRGDTGDGQEHENEDKPDKRQRIEGQQPGSAERGDRTLVQEAEEAHASPPTSHLPADEATHPLASHRLEEHSPAPTRHKRFWYDDGSVVLRVRRVLFRLHKSFLVVQSSYLRDLFADPYRPPEKYDAGSGVSLPLYLLSLEDLRVFDFERLLETLENPHAIDDRLPDDTLIAIARAAYALKFEHTHAWVTRELLVYWPNELSLVPSEPENCTDAAVDALQVSTDANIPQIRQGAFYELLRISEFGQNQGDAPLLRHADYNILVRARQFCVETWMDILLGVPQRSASCVEKEKKTGLQFCAARSPTLLSAKWLALVTVENLRRYLNDPIAGFRALQCISIPKEEKSGFCSDCRQMWQNAWNLKMRQFWDGLSEVLASKEANKAEKR